MKKHDTIIMFGMIAFSALTSFLFVSYGINIIMSPSPPAWAMTFAYVTTAYGLANIAILSISWSSRQPWAVVANKFIALCYLGAYIMDTVKDGLKSSLEVVGILALAMVLLTNWLAVKKVVTRN
jgi:hypothetical protein